MSNVVSELGDVVEMTNLTWCIVVGIRGECECERFVIGKHIELTAFYEVAEVFDCQVHCQELSIECAVLRFGMTEFPGEVGNWLPPITNPLLQDGSNRAIRGIGHDACRRMGFRVS